MDNNGLILTTDKEVALIVIDKADYIKKAEELLKEETYKKIPEDPTVKQKKQTYKHPKKHQDRGRP